MNLASLRPCAVTLLFAFSTPLVHAQVSSITQIERSLYSTGYESPSQRYSYKIGPILPANNDAWNVVYPNYPGRADRAYKLACPVPAEPFVETPPPPVAVVPEDRGFFGFGIFRRR